MHCPLFNNNLTRPERTKRNTPSFFFFFFFADFHFREIDLERDLERKKERKKVGAAVKSLVVTRLDDEGKKKKKKELLCQRVPTNRQFRGLKR